MIEAQTPLHQELCQVPIAERETEVPAPAKDDDFISHVPSPEEGRPILPHPLTLAGSSPICLQHFPEKHYAPWVRERQEQNGGGRQASLES